MDINQNFKKYKMFEIVAANKLYIIVAEAPSVHHGDNGFVDGGADTISKIHAGGITPVVLKVKCIGAGSFFVIKIKVSIGIE